MNAQNLNGIHLFNLLLLEDNKPVFIKMYFLKC